MVLPKKFRRPDTFGKGKKEDLEKCYLLHKDRILKFIDLDKQKIRFNDNYYMDFKDLVDLQYLYHIWFEEEEESEESEDIR